MSGEKSKKSGEYGENIVDKILKLIGWENSDNGVTIQCFEEDHNRKSQTHGIDYIFSLESPLMSNVQEDVLISVKHHLDKYPSGIVGKFKSHLTDLAQAMDCFPDDEHYSMQKVSENILERHVSGVIFWIASKDELEKDIVKEITQFRNLDKPEYGPIYLVDNKRANFLYNSISYSKKYYGTYKFYYHSTGYNNNDPFIKNDIGSKLPVQLINTSILPIRVDPQEGPTLLLFINEPFNSDSLKRVMGFAHRLTGTWAKNIVILYPDYIEFDHKNDVQSVKRLFQSEEFIHTVSIKSFIENVSTLGASE